MRRSLRFITIFFCLSLTVSALIGHPFQAFAADPNVEIRGVWMTTNDTNIMRDRNQLSDDLTTLQSLNFNTIYPVVWNSGYALYPSLTAQREGFQTFFRKGLQGQDILADLIAQAHQRGLIVIPWFEFGFMAPPSSELAQLHPDWLTQRQDGSQTWIGAAGEVVWLNPFMPEVQQLITHLVLEIVTQYDVDGIQFDDHMSLPSDFGYDSFTKSLYKSETKRDVPVSPQDPAWVKWRADKLTAYLTQLNKTIKSRKAGVILSVSPNPYQYAYKSSLQDWLTWVRLGIVDELIVQVYRSDLNTFAQQLIQPEIQEACRKIPTAVGILTGLRTKPVNINLIQSKVRLSRSRQLGISFFSFESLWNVASEPMDYRQARLRTLFSSPAPRRRGAGRPANVHSGKVKESRKF